MRNVVVGSVDEDLVQKFFAEGEPFVRLQVSTMEELFVAVGIFPSKGQARKNGCTGPIPSGIHQMGSQKNRFWLWCHPQATADTATTCDTRCRCERRT